MSETRLLGLIALAIDKAGGSITFSEEDLERYMFGGDFYMQQYMDQVTDEVTLTIVRDER